MGFTRYWTPFANIAPDDWAEICADIRTLLGYIATERLVPLAEEYDQPADPVFIGPDHIRFNGVGDDGHETFWFSRVRSDDDYTFCKTEHKPYDIAVVAVLCYLATVREVCDAEADGDQRSWVDGLAVARAALPRYANILDIPMGQLQKDRWISPWVRTYPETGYDVHFCVDGYGYVIRRKCGTPCRLTALELAQFLDANKAASFKTRNPNVFRGHGYGRDEPDIWDATGVFDDKRHTLLAKAQTAVFDRLFAAVTPDRQIAPPAYVRIDALPAPDAERPYYIPQLLAQAGDTAATGAAIAAPPPAPAVLPAPRGNTSQLRLRL